MGRIGQVVHFLGIQQQVVEGDVVVGQKPRDRCGQVVVAHPEVADQLVAAVENAAEQLAFLEVRHADLFDEAFERLHAAMELLAGLVGGHVEHLGRVAAKPFRVDGGDHIVGQQAARTGFVTAAAGPDRSGIAHHAREIMSFQERVEFSPLGLRQAGERQDRGHQIEMGTHRIRPAATRVARIGDHQRHVDGLLERHAALLAQVMGAALLAVIGGEDDDRVIGLAACVQRIQHGPDVPVHVEMAIEVVVDVVVPHVPALLRDLAVVHVAQALVAADGRRLPLQVVEEGGRQGGRPFLAVQRRIRRAENREHALGLHGLRSVGIVVHHVVRVDEVHGHEPRFGGGDFGGAFVQPLHGFRRNQRIFIESIHWPALHVAPVLVLGEAVGLHRRTGALRRKLREMPFAFIDGVIAQIAQHVADGGQGFRIGLHVVDPGEIGVVEHAGVRRMPARQHHRAGRRAHGGGAMVMVERDPAGANAVPVGQSEFRRHGLVGIFLIGHDHQDVGFFAHDSFSSVVRIPVLRGLDCALIAASREPLPDSGS